MPKVLLSVSFDADFSVEEPYEKTLARAHELVGHPGLIWKIWLRDEANSRAGGAYLFEDRASAEAWAEGEMSYSAERFPWIHNLQYTYGEVREELSEITLAPLAAPRS
jgi:hypothetical protein